MGIIRKTIGTICMVIGMLIVPISIFVGYLMRNYAGFMILAFSGLILMAFGYFLYPSERARAFLEEFFHFDEDGNLQ
ncbi:MAG: hypothetical protein CMA28_05535 [Euryarchaeota archaeon]|nr:hypothetical protein [Euryarchaeota archaeon]